MINQFSDCLPAIKLGLAGQSFAFNIMLKHLQPYILPAKHFFSLFFFMTIYVVIPPSVHATKNATAVQALTTASTFESISVYAPFIHDDNTNNTASLEWKKSTDSTWTTGLVMTVDRRTTVTGGSQNYDNPYGKQWRGSLIGLESNTSYDIRVTFSDSDGITQANLATTTVSTRSETITTGGSTYYVAKNGRDTNLGTIDQPFLTIQRGQNALSAGDTLLVRTGTYNEQVTVNRVGTASQWVSIEAYPSEEVIVDGQDKRAWNFSFAKYSRPPTQYVRLKGFKLTNTTKGAIKVLGSTYTHDIIIENNIIEGFYSYGIYIGRWDSSDTNASNVVIQGNIINRTKLGSPINGYTNIGLYSNLGGHIIRNNTIKDTTGHPQSGSDRGDCIGGGPDTNLNTGVSKDTDIYNNTFIDCNDDLIQADGMAMNVRIWGNTLKGLSTNWSAISLAPVMVGPVYVFNNIAYGQITNAVKQGNNSTGQQYIFNNTFYMTNAADTFFQTDPGLYNVWSRNNILHSGKYILEYTTVDAGPTLSFDYDNMFATDGIRFIQWQDDAQNNNTWENFRASNSQEFYGLNINSTNEFINAELEDFHLAGTSQLIDHGVVITGYNDLESAWAYRGVAPDIGAYEYIPLAATLLSPSGVIGGNYSPTYAWNEIADATWYCLWISRVNSDGSLTTAHYEWHEASVICNGTICSLTPAVTLSDGNYRWWVQTWNEGGYSPWSIAMNFTISMQDATTYSESPTADDPNIPLGRHPALCRTGSEALTSNFVVRQSLICQSRSGYDHLQ